MQLSRAFRHGLSRDAERVVDVVRIGVGLSRRAKEATELTINIADVRWIEMTIDVEVSRAPVLRSPDGVGKFAQRVEIVGGEQSNAVFQGKAFAIIYFRANLVKS